MSFFEDIWRRTPLIPRGGALYETDILKGVKKQPFSRTCPQKNAENASQKKCSLWIVAEHENEKRLKKKCAADGGVKSEKWYGSPQKRKV